MKTLSYRLLPALLLALALLAGVRAPVRAYAAEGTTPTLGITHAPLHGSGEYLLGKVQVPEGASFDPSDYRVTAYVQVADGQQAWVKPTQATPYVDVLADGTFALKYDSGGSGDRNAAYLHVLLIPADYTPSLHGLEAAKAIAYDYAKVTRPVGSACEVEPADRLLASPGKPSGLSVSATKIAVGVGLYPHGNPGDELGEKQVRALLSRIATFADTVRFYRAGGQEHKAYAIAHELGLKVVGTALLTGNAAQDKAEMDTLVELCNAGYAQVACVGNETLYAGTLTDKELVADIAYVRSGLADESIPVTTSETLGLLIDHPLVRSACDILMPNTYPFWEGTSIAGAMTSFEGALEALANSSPGKEIVVSETGWPSAGDKNGNAITGEGPARTYFDGVRQWSLDSQTVVLWFAAVDEAWKSGNNGEGTVGAHWGLLDTELHVKEGFADLELFSPLAGEGIALLDGDVTMQGGSYSYDGSPKTPAVSVVHEGETLTRGVHYSVTYENNVNAGVARVVVQGMGDYTGSVTRTFAIGCAAPVVKSVQNARGGMRVTWNKVPGAVAYRVFCKKGSGSWQKVADTTSTSFLAKTSNGKARLRTGTKYAFTARCIAGTGSATYTSGYDSTGKAQVYVASTKVSRAKAAAGGKATIRWKRVAKAGGYTVQYSTKKRFTSGVKTVTVKRGKRVSATIKSLAKGKTYYVRVRTYKKVSGKTQYSAWSAAKRVKAK